MEINAAGILGIGSCLPEKVLKNSDIEKMVDTSDEWIVKRTGISERRVLEKDQPAYKLGVEASLRAIKDAGISAEDIELVICATTTPDYIYPQTACLIQGNIGAAKAAAFDMNAACSGFVYALSVGQQYVATGLYKYVLVVGCEGISRTVDWKDRNTCILFGDAAGAVVLGKVEDGYGVLSTVLGADGASGNSVTLPFCHFEEVDLEVRKNERKSVIWMNGGEVFKFAVKIMADASEEAAKKAELSMENIDMIFPHQANTRILDGAMKRLGLTDEKIFPIIQKYGNISSASIPVTMDEAYRAGRLKKGDNLILVGFGGGLTWASAALRWSK